MARKCLAFLAVAAVLVMCAGGASAKALKQQVDVTPDGTAKVILNYSKGKAGLIANVNAKGLMPDATYTVNVGVLVAVEDPLTGVVTEELDVYGSGTFVTKPAKPEKEKDNLKGNGEPKKPKKPKKPKPCKGHVNIHIPWDDPETPPVLLELTVTITGVANGSE